LIASLSSKSENRFLVNFQTKKATTPMTAMPPATDKPMIEPVPRPEESDEGGGAAAADVELGEAELVKVTVTSEPLMVVRLGPGGGVVGRDEADGGEDEEEEEVVDFEALSAEDELVEVVVVAEAVVVAVVASVANVVVVVRPPGCRTP